MPRLEPLAKGLQSAGALLRPHLPDALMVTGAAAIAYGAWLVYPPAGYAVCGGFLFAAGWFSARSGAA